MKIYRCREGKHDIFFTKIQSRDDSKNGSLGISFVATLVQNILLPTTYVVYGLPQ